MEGYISETVRDSKLALTTNRKSYMSLRLVPKLFIVHLQRRTSPYFALFHRIRWLPRRTA